MRKNTLLTLVDYLVDNGVDEGEVNHLLHRKIFNSKSLMEYIQSDDWESVWRFAESYTSGDFI
jgi:hypothetical protein